MKKALKIIAITLGSLLGLLLVAMIVSFIFIPDKMGRLGDGMAKMTGTRIDTVYVDLFRSSRGDIVDCNLKTLVIGNERIHPYGNLAASTLGVYKSDGDTTIATGIEKVFCRGLNGKGGYEIFRTDLKTGEQKFVRFVRRKDGPRVPLNLDIELQAVADSVMRAEIAKIDGVKDACVIIASTENGAIRTMANLNRLSSGEYADSCNTAISFPYSAGMMLSPATALAAVKCDTTKNLGNYDLNSPSDLREMYRDCDIETCSDTLKSMLVGEYSDQHFELEGRASIRFSEVIDSMSKRYIRESRPCGYGIFAPALEWLKLYTAIARGGDGTALWLVGWVVDEENCMVNDCIFWGSDSYYLCSKEQADTLTESLKRSLKSDILHDARYELAGHHGRSYTADNDGKYNLSDPKKRSGQSSFTGFFPADDPAFSIICMLHMSPFDATFDCVQRTVSGIVRGIVDSDVMADRVEKVKRKD